MVTRLRGLQRRLAVLQQEEAALARQSAARVEHLQELYSIPSLADVKYEEWSQVRLDRLLVDYLLRMGYEKSARALAREKRIADLVDLEVFAHCHKIADSLERGSTTDALAWCTEHRALMKKSNVTHLLDYVDRSLWLMGTSPEQSRIRTPPSGVYRVAPRGAAPGSTAARSETPGVALGAVRNRSL